MLAVREGGNLRGSIGCAASPTRHTRPLTHDGITSRSRSCQHLTFWAFFNMLTTSGEKSLNVSTTSSAVAIVFQPGDIHSVPDADKNVGMES